MIVASAENETQIMVKCGSADRAAFPMFAPQCIFHHRHHPARTNGRNARPHTFALAQHPWSDPAAALTFVQKWRAASMSSSAISAAKSFQNNNGAAVVNPASRHRNRSRNGGGRMALVNEGTLTRRRTPPEGQRGRSCGIPVERSSIAAGRDDTHLRLAAAAAPRQAPGSSWRRWTAAAVQGGGGGGWRRSGHGFRSY